MTRKALWKRLRVLTNLEELSVFVHAVDSSAKSSLGRCSRLRRLSVKSGDRADKASALAQFMSGFPAGLKELRLEQGVVYDNVLLASPLRERHFAQLPELQVLVLVEHHLSDWTVLEPVAAKLRKLSMECYVPFEGEPFQVGIGAADALRKMHCLEELSIDGLSGLDDDMICGAFAAAPSLCKVYLRPADLSDEGFAAALRGAACAHSLRELGLLRERWTGWNNVGDLALTAIGTYCPLLTKLGMTSPSPLSPTGLSTAGLESLGRGCTQLVELDLDNCNAVNETGAMVIGKHFSRLERLTLSGTGLDPVADGRPAILRGCKRLKTFHYDIDFYNE